MTDRPIWFAPRRYGWGTGMPVAWQGWALSAALMTAIVLAVFVFGQHNVRGLAIAVPAILIYVPVAAWTTKGGLRWRWGEEE